MVLPFDDLKDFIEAFNEYTNKAQSKAIFTRDITQQRDEVENLNILLSQIGAIKKENIEAKKEAKSNFLYCLELNVQALKCELMLIISLKEDQCSLAWDYLINAQNAVSISVENYPFEEENYLLGFSKRLQLYEALLFPEMVFMSRGAIVGETECSICGKSYEDCDHIKGKVYMGELCSEIIHEFIKVEEISFVNNPADKRCRVNSFSKDGKMIDVLTYREIS